MKGGMLKGILFWLLVGLPAVMGTFFMLVPTLPLLLVNHRMFRRVVDFMVAFYLVFVVSVIEVYYGIKIVVSGDMIDSKGGDNLIIMNHRTRLDWLFFWACLWRNSFSCLLQQRIALKYPIKFWPGIGPPTQFAAFIFMKRDFTYDKQLLSKMLDYYRRIGTRTQLIFFPEGTDKCPNATKNSNAYAEKYDLTRYEYVLHPRVTGFSYVAMLMKKAGQLNNIYDVTVAYKTNSVIPQDEKALLNGNFPTEVHFRVQCHPSANLPNDEDELQEFCKERWKEKEIDLEKFYNKHVNLDGGSSGLDGGRGVCHKLLLALMSIYWIPFTVISLFYTFSSFYVFCFVSFSLILLSSINRIYNGLDLLQADL